MTSRPRWWPAGLLLASTFGCLNANAAPPAPSPFVDHRGQAPGRTHTIRPSDLPPPNQTRAADNPPRIVPRPKDAWPQAPAGFKVQLYADGLERPPAGAHRAERRRVRRGQPRQHRAGVSGSDRGRQSGAGRDVRQGIQTTVRDRVLSAVGRAPVALRRQHRLGGSLSVQERRPSGPRRGRKDRRRVGRRAAARRRALDPRHCVLAGRQEDVRVDRLVHEQRRSRRQSQGEKPGADPAVQPGRDRRAGLRFGDSQPGWHRRPSPNRDPVGVGQRTRQPGRQPGPGLHHADQGGRVLRLALVLHRRQRGSRATGENIPSSRRRSSSRTCCCSRTSPRCR